MVIFKRYQAIMSMLTAIKHELKKISAAGTAIHATLKTRNENTLSFDPSIKVVSFCGAEGNTDDVVKENIKIAIVERLSGIVQSDISQK